MKSLTHLKSKFKKILGFYKPASGREKPIQAMQLNLFLLEAAMKYIQKRHPRKASSLFTTQVLNSKSHHVSALVKQAESLCDKQDIALFLYKELFCQSRFSLRRAVQLNLSNYVKTQQEALELLLRVQKDSPKAFRRHLITLLKEGGPTSFQLENEAKSLEERWIHSQKSTYSQSKVSPV